MQGISLPIEVLNKIYQIMFIWKRPFIDKKAFENEEQLSMQTRDIANAVGKSPSIWFEYNALFNVIPLKWKENLMFTGHQYSQNTGARI